MKKVAIYLRVSTEEQARILDGSLVSQRQRLIDYVDGQNSRGTNWGSIVDFYIDEGKSAKDMKRAEFQRLLADVKSGRINLILSTELSRLSRSISDFCTLWDLFKKHNTSFITLREQFDTTTAAGELMVFNLINFAQFERKQTAERIAANWQSRAKRGLWNGGTIPFGFDRNEKNKAELLPNAEEAKQLKEIFELFLEVGSVRQTCLELSKKAIFSKRFINKYGIQKGGGHFTIPSLQRLLSNRAYIGIREIGVSKGRKLELVKASWKPLISEALFQKVQDRLTLNKNKLRPADKKTYAFPLTEILVCGECGKHLGGKSATSRNKGKHFYYGHPRQLNSDGITHLKRCKVETVRAHRIENILLESLKKLLDDPEKINHYLDIYLKGNQQNLPALQGKINSLDQEIKTLGRKNQNLIERLSDLPKEFAADSIYNQMKANNQKVKELEATLFNLQSKQHQMNYCAIDKEGLIFKIRRTIQNLEKSPIEYHSRIYKNLISFAELHATKIRMGVFAPIRGSLALKMSGNRAGSCTVMNGAQ